MSLSAAIFFAEGPSCASESALFLLAASFGDAAVAESEFSRLLAITPAVLLMDLRSPGRLDTPVFSDIKNSVFRHFGWPIKSNAFAFSLSTHTLVLLMLTRTCRTVACLERDLDQVFLLQLVE